MTDLAAGFGYASQRLLGGTAVHKKIETNSRTVFLILFSTLLLSATPVHAAQKRALIITIGQYLPETGWQPLSSDRDYPLIERALLTHGFSRENIKRLTDAAATRGGILDAIKSELVEPAGTGDVVVLHFSGHGQQITDDDHDEIDGYDEAIVPYDAPQRLGQGYTGDKHLRDDDLGAVLRELRAKVGPRGDVLVLLDSCHSGTAARGADSPYPHAVRGTDIPIGDPQTRDGALGNEAGGGFVDANRDEGLVAATFAPMVVMSAERHNRLAEEASDDSGQSIGPLTWAVSGALAAAGQQTSYRDLFETVRSRTAARQIPNTPQAEGDVDRTLFGGLAVTQEPFFRVLRLSPADRFAALDGGTLVGLNENSVVEIHREGARAPTRDTLVATGTVGAASAFRSELVLTDVLDPAATSGRAFVTQQAFGSLRVSVYVDAPPDAAWGSAVRDALEQAGSESTSFVVPLANRPTTVAAGDASKIVLIREHSSEPQQHAVVLETWDSAQALGSPILSTAADLGVTVVGRLRAFAQNTYLRTLDARAPSIGAEIDLVPCKLKCDSERICAGEACECVEEGRPEEFLSDGNELRVHHGQGFGLRLRNVGTGPAFVTILDLMPDGQIGLIWPLPNTPVDDTVLPKDATYRIVDPNRDDRLLAFRACPPYGTDVLKVIATTEAVDFGPITAFGARARGGESGPLDVLFRESLVGERGVSPTFSSGSVSTSALTITIEPPVD